LAEGMRRDSMPQIVGECEKCKIAWYDGTLVSCPLCAEKSKNAKMERKAERWRKFGEEIERRMLALTDEE
jgi:hypothetical protein